MSIVDASGWVAWYVEVSHDHPNVNADVPVELDAYGSPRRRKMLALPLVVWRELEHLGVCGMVTREVDDDEADTLMHAGDVLVHGQGDTRFVFSHYALRADDV